MKIKVQKKTDVSVQKIAEFAYIINSKKKLPGEEIPEEVFAKNISERITTNCYDFVFIAEKDEKISGWLALYKIEGSIAQIWNWHPVVMPNEGEERVAKELILEAFKHLIEKGLHQVTIDFRVKASTRSYFNKYIEWYAQTGITENIEEKCFKKTITDEICDVVIPKGYTIGYISETRIEELYDCWVEIFSASDDQFIQGLNAERRREFFFYSWNKEKPMIKEASLTLHHKGKLVGFCRLLPLYGSTNGYLAPIGILPEYRRKSLAEKLLKKSMGKLKALNYQTMSFFVSTKNYSAIAFYEKLGFVAEYSINSLFGNLSSPVSGEEDQQAP